MTRPLDRRQLIHAIRTEWQYAVGDNYRIELEPLSDTSLRELHRLMRDLGHEKRSAVRRAQMMPWRRP